MGSTFTTTTRFLHVANGDCTTDLIERAGIAGARSIWADVLHDGPVPGELTDDELLRVRAAFLADGVRESVDDVVEGLRRWRSIVDDDTQYDELVLWYEHDLFDQLNLIQLLSWIGRRRPLKLPRCVSLICIGSFPGREHFKGLGELSPQELAPLLDTRQPLEDAQYDLAARAWRAVRSPDPRAIEEVLQGDTSALPFLAPALRRYLEELPSTRDGLSKSERRVLELASASSGAIDLRSTFPRMHHGETAFYISDGSFWSVVQQLAASSPPLMTTDVDDPSILGLPKGTAALTDTGRAVLAGSLDRVRDCGIDRWLGGVHLEGNQALWRWDDVQKRVVRA
jgi:hypothetical protein